MSLNKVMLIGRLGRDPELKSTQSGKPVATFSLATSEKWNDRDGEKKERTEWHNIVAWDKLADLAAKYLAKGKEVYIEGRIQSRKYDGKDGSQRTAYEIVATAMTFIGSAGNGEAKQGAQPQSHNEPFAGATDDDIPF